MILMTLSKCPCSAPFATEEGLPFPTGLISIISAKTLQVRYLSRSTAHIINDCLFSILVSFPNISGMAVLIPFLCYQFLCKVPLQF